MLPDIDAAERASWTPRAKAVFARFFHRYSASSFRSNVGLDLAMFVDVCVRTALGSGLSIKDLLIGCHFVTCMHAHGHGVCV